MYYPYFPQIDFLFVNKGSLLSYVQVISFGK